jgi:acetolactate synthase-1/2/3 large subunit
VKGATLRVYPQGQAKSKGLYQADLPSGMDFSKIAEAAGGYGEKLVDPTETTAAIARCLAQIGAGRSALLHVCVTKL